MKKLFALFILLSSTALAQFSGTYYIGSSGTKPGGGDPDYATLKAANDAVNAGTVTGNVTFYITSDLTEPANTGLGVNTSGFSITYKPADDITTKTITFSQATDNGGPSGGFVIGMPNVNDWTTLLTTDNVVIDGYADAGSTKRLIWRTSAAMHYLDGPLAIAGNSNNITIKNCTVIHEGVASAGGSNVFGIAIRNRNATAVNYVPDNITIDNNDITITNVNAGNGVGVSASGTPTAFATGIVIKNNTITARHRGTFMSYSTSYEVSGNIFQINQTVSGFASAAIAGNLGNTGTHNVFNNKITQLATANTAGAANGIRGIQASGGGTYNIYNNFISGFATPATGTTELIGIRIGVASNIYHNTIVMSNVTTTGGGTQPYAGIVTFTASTDVRNNITINEEDDFVSYCIYGAPIPTTSDYNDFYRSGTTNANIGFNTTAQPTLLDWQTSTSKDANSKSVAVTFFSAIDLHLFGGSPGDVNLIGVTGLGIATDIDGQTRDAAYPYMGADEDPTNPLPVQLTLFSASAVRSGVELRWSTATETNNHGFEVERRILGAATWQMAGFVAGAGTSTSPREYSYVDANVAAGHYAYRIKQIDNNGSFKYFGAAEVEIGSMAKDFKLESNYPNPFNPSTTIEFTVADNGKASLKVYNIVGQEVATLFDGEAEAGKLYQTRFNASHLASGTYISVLQSGNQRIVKKMLLMK